MSLTWHKNWASMMKDKVVSSLPEASKSYCWDQCHFLAFCLEEPLIKLSHTAEWFPALMCDFICVYVVELGSMRPQTQKWDVKRTNWGNRCIKSVQVCLCSSVNVTTAIIKHQESIIKIICVLSHSHLTLKTLGKKGDTMTLNTN